MQASRQAIAFAAWSGAGITALHIAAPADLPSDDVSPPIVSQRREALVAAARGWMRTQFAEAFETGTKVDLEVQSGSAADEILQRAADLPADLIVLGTHGASGFTRMVLGSVTEKVLRLARCPVLTVPPHGIAVSRLPFKRILCGIDFSDSSLSALEYALTVALGSRATLTLAHVLEWPWHEPPSPAFDQLPAAEAEALRTYRQRREHEALARLQALLPETLREQCRAQVVHGRPYTELLRLAAEDQADLIVLGVHGRNVVDTALFGSTANQAVRQATCPVLTVRG